MPDPIIHLSIPPCYKYKGWMFEYDRNKPFGPWPLKKDGELRKRAGRKFWKIFQEFSNLPIAEQEKFYS